MAYFFKTQIQTLFVLKLLRCNILIQIKIDAFCERRMPIRPAERSLLASQPATHSESADLGLAERNGKSNRRLFGFVVLFSSPL
jgi:hypothetical protein